MTNLINPIKGIFDVVITPAPSTRAGMLDEGEDIPPIEVISKSCDTCARYHPEVTLTGCDAFDIIPTEIFLGYIEHKVHYSQNGIEDGLLTYLPREVD